VRDDLHGAAEVVAAALLADHALVDLAGGGVVPAPHPGGLEALVMAEIQVGFGAILGHEHLPVLERAHGARIHVDVRVQLDVGDFDAARFEDRGEGGGGYPLTQGRNYATSNEYEVIVEVKPEYQRDASALGQLYIRPTAPTPTNVPTATSQMAQTPTASSVSAQAMTSSALPAAQSSPSPTSPSKLVPLSAVATLSNSVGPLLVNHVGQLPSATISFNLRPGASLSQATEQIQKLANDTLPLSITFGFQGTAQVFQSSLQNLTLLLVVAVMVIYLVLGVLYESFIHPLTILSGLPSAGLGALLTLLLFGRELDVYAFVGLIMLIGIVEKNAIMMIDFALDAQRNEAKLAEEAIFQACIIRFRPIMMTTMAALMGTLPIALGWGAGATSRRGLGLAVVGGLAVSQVLTLYLTPVVYIYFELTQARLTNWMQRRRQKAEDLGPMEA